MVGSPQFLWVCVAGVNGTSAPEVSYNRGKNIDCDYKYIMIIGGKYRL